MTNPRTNSRSILNSFAVVFFLFISLACGASWHYREQVMIWCAKGDRDDILRIYLALDPKLANYHGERAWPLATYVLRDARRCARLMLESGANPNSSPASLLVSALIKRKPAMVELLLKHKAVLYNDDPRIHFFGGKTRAETLKQIVRKVEGEEKRDGAATFLWHMANAVKELHEPEFSGYVDPQTVDEALAIVQQALARAEAKPRVRRPRG